MAAMSGSPNGEPQRSIKADVTCIASGTRDGIFRIPYDPYATGTYRPPAPKNRRVGDIILFDDGSWIPVRKLSKYQKMAFGI